MNRSVARNAYSSQVAEGWDAASAPLLFSSFMKTPPLICFQMGTFINLLQQIVFQLI